MWTSPVCSGSEYREGGLDRFDANALGEGTFTHYRHDPEDPASLRDNHVASICQDRSGALWAGVLMISLGTISVRTRILHRELAILTYALALFLLLCIGLSMWVGLVFPGCVLIVSLYILVLSLRIRDAGAEDDLANMIG